jgi:hypothetical protein
MARVKNNDLIENLSGKVGNKLVYKTYAYGTVVSKYPNMSKVKLSLKQKRSNELFRKAVAYAQSIIADPKEKKKYESKLKPGKTVYNTALAEYLKKSRA